MSRAARPYYLLHMSLKGHSQVAWGLVHAFWVGAFPPTVAGLESSLQALHHLVSLGLSAIPNNLLISSTTRTGVGAGMLRIPHRMMLGLGLSLLPGLTDMMCRCISSHQHCASQSKDGQAHGPTQH